MRCLSLSEIIGVRLFRKKIVLLTIGMLCCFQMLTHAQFSIGAHAFLSTSKLTEAGSQWKTAGKIGLSADYTFANKLVVLSGLECVIRGANSMWDDGNKPLIKEFECDLYYLELPVSIGYSLALKDHIKLVPNLGMYFAYGFYGWGEIKSFNFEAEQEMNRAYSTEWHPFRKGKDNILGEGSEKTPYVMNRFDCGVRVGVNAHVYHFVFSTSYEIGLTNTGLHYGLLGKDGFVRNETFSVGVGYRF